MAPWIFELKFPYRTQFLFGSLMFAARENINLELLTRGQRQVIASRSTEKLRIIRLILQCHQHQAAPAQV
jgi:hypothetical protein